VSTIVDAVVDCALATPAKERARADPKKLARRKAEIVIRKTSGDNQLVD
jgi:hypothetical protein